jgi:CRP/FNR family transcriptional regulator
MTETRVLPAEATALIENLRSHRVLGKLPLPELTQLVETARLRRLAARERLFAMGDPGNALFIILSGWIKIVRTGANGRDIVLELAGASNVFGELASIIGAPRGADAVALAETRVIAINGAAFVQALRRNPDALLELTRVVCERLARVNAQLEDTLSVPAEVRLARTLMRLAALDPRPSPEGLLVDLGLSQKELGDITGLSREGTNRQMALWRDAGLIHLEGRVVTLSDHAGLRRIAEM